MKVITFTAIKGGVGKTTMTFNFASWLSNQNKKILLIDLDHQCNLTTLFEETRKNNTVAEVFQEDGNGEVKIDKVGEYIDLIPGYLDLDDIANKLESNSNKEMLLYLWIRNNYDELNLEKYDYILIDTHPDFSTITKNAIAISDYLISPITPSEHGYNAKFDLETRLEKFRKQVFNYATGETYIDAKLYFVANMIKHNTSTSHELLEHISDDENVLDYIPEKELFNKASTQHISVFDIAKNDEKTERMNKVFYQKIEQVFSNITNKFI